MTSPGAGGRLRLGLPVAALVLGGLVLVLAVAYVPLARLSHQSLNATTASLPVWVTAPGAVGAFVVAWRKPLGWVALLAQPGGLLGLVLFGLVSCCSPTAGRRPRGGGGCCGPMPVSAWYGWPGPPSSRWARSSAATRR